MSGPRPDLHQGEGRAVDGSRLTESRNPFAPDRGKPPLAAESVPLAGAGIDTPGYKRRHRWAELISWRPSASRSRSLGHDRRGYRMRRLLAAGDCAAILVTGGAMLALEALTRFTTAPENPLLLAPVALLIWVILAALTGAYHVDERRIEASTADELGGIAQLAAVWTWVLFLIETVGATGSTPVTPAIVLWLLSVPAIVSARALVRRFARRRPWYLQHALVVGQANDALRVIKLLQRHPEFGVEAIRSVDLEPGVGVSRVDSLIDLAELTDVDRVIFASSYEGLDERTGALRFLSEKGIKVDLVPGDSEVFRSDAELHFVEGLPILTLPTTARPRSSAALKRAIDIGVSGTLLVLLAPFFAYAAIRIKLDSPGPVFFRQYRVGRREERFELLKFRTMECDAEGRKAEVASLNVRTDGMFKIAHDPRVTRYGTRLRRWSLDELPQLINVLRGEMSLVGPRPLIPAESQRVTEHYLARFNVRPGISGPWQVLGRSEIPFHVMLKLDYTYVTNWTVSDDIKLLVRTLSAIIHGRGAY